MSNDDTEPALGLTIKSPVAEVAVREAAGLSDYAQTLAAARWQHDELVARIAAMSDRASELEEKYAWSNRRLWTVLRLFERSNVTIVPEPGGTTTFGEHLVVEDDPWVSSLFDLPPAHDMAQQHAVGGALGDILDASGRMTPAHGVYLRLAAGLAYEGRLDGALSTAHDVFMSAALCHAADMTDAPPPEVIDAVRLPFDRVAVTFATPVRPPSLTVHVPEPTTWGLATGGTLLVLGCEEWRIVGVVLSARADGQGVADEVLWLVQGTVDFDETVTVPDDGELRKGGEQITGRSAFTGTAAAALDSFSGIVAIPGYLSRSELAGFAYSVAALVAIKTPDAVTFGDAEPFTDADAKAARKGTSSFRRNAARGRFSPKVRVIDLKASERSGPSNPTGRSVKAHWRRGHWRRVRCGPRGDQWFEPRFIAPVWVEGGNQAEGVQVWRAS